MRIAVVGAGAVGGYYAALPGAAGHDVAVVARGAHLDAIRARGLLVRAARGEFVVHPAASDDPREIGSCDLVLLRREDVRQLHGTAAAAAARRGGDDGADAAERGGQRFRRGGTSDRSG